MAVEAVDRSMPNRKIISVSGKRQVTIPQKYFETLGFGHEAECILQNNAIIIRPVKENLGSEFSEQILSDLISQGLSGEELLIKFKEMNKKVIPAIKLLVKESDSIARGEKKSSTIDELFEAEDK